MSLVNRNRLCTHYNCVKGRGQCFVQRVTGSFQLAEPIEHSTVDFSTNSHKLQTQSKYITSQMSCVTYSQKLFFESVELLPSLYNVHPICNILDNHRLKFIDPRGSAALIIDNSTQWTLGTVQTDSFNSVKVLIKICSDPHNLQGTSILIYAGEPSDYAIMDLCMELR
ncbi:Hypothetical_protein [Hexamita inflata]|uniref:Hypothetical_protein n=1 Tax=Hexamita inflata TaxID=28002 RepID=A0AA86P598_9EUKA|nr:Hypothetical protein HINF_LOCUS19924 [Hexamita inflata]